MTVNYTTIGGEERSVVLQPRNAPRRKPDDGLSDDARRTKRNNDLLASGTHPATYRKLLGGIPTCGECAHHHAVTHYTTGKLAWHKCDLHRLGMSHSSASDIRVSWPACDAFEEDDRDREVER